MEVLEALEAFFREKPLLDSREPGGGRWGGEVLEALEDGKH